MQNSKRFNKDLVLTTPARFEQIHATPEVIRKQLDTEMSAQQIHNSQVQAEGSKIKAKSNTMEKFLVGGGEKLLNGLDK